MSTNDNRYPRRSEHGDPTPVCEWCGNRVNIPRAWREFGTYCSIECQAADRRWYYTGSLVTSLILLIWSLEGIFVGYQVLPFIGIALFSIVWLLYSGGMVNIGRRVVQSHSETIDDAELEKVCSTLIDILQINQTTKGVTRKVLFADLRSKGFSNSTIKIGIEYLLMSEKIRKIGLSRYISVS